MPETYEEANKLAVRSAGASPTWYAFDGSTGYEYDGAPESAGEGQYLNGALRTLIRVDPRLLVHQRRAVITITYDAAGTYTILVDGNTTGALGVYGTEALALAGIAAGVDALAGVTATVEDLDGDGTDDAVVVLGDAEADYSISVSAAGGAAAIACEADAATADVRVYGRAGAKSGSTAPGSWAQLYRPDGLPIEFSIGHRGMVERIDTSGFSRLYVEADLYGHPADGAMITYSATVRYAPTEQE